MALTPVKTVAITTIVSVCCFLAFTASTSCANSIPDFKSGKVIISGHAKLSPGSSRVISLIYSQLSATPTRLTSILDSAGRFQFEFEILQAHDMTLRYEKGMAVLYVKPADSLYIQLTSSDFQQSRYPHFLISGTHPETSRDILSYHLFTKLESFKPVPDHKSTEEYVGAIKKRIALEDSILTVFSRTHPSTDEFKTWAKKDILYRNANYLVDFEAFHSFYKTKFKGVLYDTTLFPVNDTDAIASSWYQYHLWQYAMANYIQGDTGIQNLLREQKLAEAYAAGLKKIIAHEKPTVSRDIMCYQLLFTLSERAPKDFQLLMKNVDSYLSIKVLVSALQEKARKSESQANYQIALFKPDTQEEKEILGDLMDNLISLHKGKVIYIDIWATWCGPCRSEVPYAIDLYDYYKGQPIVFVNLCLSSDREAWKQAIEKQKIVGENYYFNKDQSELLTRKLKLAGFPTYLIIDKTGQIVDKQAPRPSSGPLIKTRLTTLMQ